MTKFTAGVNQKFESRADIEPKLAELVDGITEVHLGGNSYGVGACEALGEKFAHISTLEVANLDDMFTGRLRAEIPQSLDAMLTALLKCPKLHTINLSDNAFGIATIDPLEKFFSQHTPLQHLILANNGFGPEAGARVGRALEELAAKKKAANHPVKLETVICGRNRLENGSMAAWASYLKAHGTIKDLRLYQNGIRQEGVEILMREGLRYLPDLEVLDIQDNTFTAQGTKAMVEVLDNWTRIRDITISDCLLSKKGAVKFAQKLSTVSSLTALETLRLQYDEMTVDGLRFLKDAVKNTLPQLRLLEINGNIFSEEDDLIEEIRGVFEERGFGELDELDDMEEEDSEEDESEEEESEEEREMEAAARDARYAEEEPVAADSNTAADDELAKKLEKTTI